MKQQQTNDVKTNSIARITYSKIIEDKHGYTSNIFILKKATISASNSNI